MGHSSIVPVALPISIVIGLAFYSFFHGSCGMDAASAIALAKIACGVANLGIGIPKNALLGDILSLLAMRPISLVAAVCAVGWIAGP